MLEFRLHAQYNRNYNIMCKGPHKGGAYGSGPNIHWGPVSAWSGVRRARLRPPIGGVQLLGSGIVAPYAKFPCPDLEDRLMALGSRPNVVTVQFTSELFNAPFDRLVSGDYYPNPANPELNRC